MIQIRIKKYLDYKEVTPYKFCKDLGLSMGYLDKKGSIGMDKYLKIREYCRDVNPEWLLTGKGEMLRSDTVAQDPPPQAVPSLCTTCTAYKETITLLKEQIGVKDQQIDALLKQLASRRIPTVINDV